MVVEARSAAIAVTTVLAALNHAGFADVTVILCQALKVNGRLVIVVFV